MSELILLQNKIVAIKNIQKITHTMQLIAMSSLTALRKKEHMMKLYSESITSLLSKVTTIQTKNEPVPKQESGKILCIILGSQKGLCGNFNTQLKQPIREFIHKYEHDRCDFAVVGNQIIKIIESIGITNIIYTEPIFNQRSRDLIAEKLLLIALMYKSVYVISNHFITFFSQETVCTKIFPVAIQQNAKIKEESEYIFDEPIHNITQFLVTRYMHTQLSFLLYQSLLSECSARFASMESATRNAKTLLEQTKVTFNKLRQSKITTEITELSANF